MKWFIALAIILVGYLIYSTFKFGREGFTLTTTVWSDETIKKYKDYMVSLQPDTEPSTYDNTISQYESIGVPESSVDTYVETGSWPYSDKTIKLLKNLIINDPNIKNQPNFNGKSNDEILTYIQSMVPGEMYNRMIGFGSSIMHQISFNKIAKTKNIGMCNTDASGNNIGNGLYKLDVSGNITTDLIDNKELPGLIPGFKFLSDEVCNPCSTDFNCPFALPDANGVPLLPGLGTGYFWGTTYTSTLKPETITPDKGTSSFSLGF